MSQNSSELDITDRQLLVDSPQPASVWTEIGEAEVTHTIFGKAKVRIIRKNDNTRHTLLLTAIVAVVVIAAVAWQGWVNTRQTALQQGAEPVAPVSVNGQEGAPVSPPENMVPPAVSPSMDSTPMKTEVAQPVVTGNNAPQPVQVVQEASSVPAKPAAPKRPKVNKPQTENHATSDRTSRQNAIPMPPRQPGTPYVAGSRSTLQPATGGPEVAAPPAMNSAASSPEPVIQLSSPVGEEPSSNQPPADTTPPAQTGLSPGK